MLCKSCGRTVKSDYKFCPYCSARLYQDYSGQYEDLTPPFVLDDMDGEDKAAAYYPPDPDEQEQAGAFDARKIIWAASPPEDTEEVPNTQAKAAAPSPEDDADFRGFSGQPDPPYYVYRPNSPLPKTFKSASSDAFGFAGTDENGGEPAAFATSQDDISDNDLSDEEAAAMLEHLDFALPLDPDAPFSAHGVEAEEDAFASETKPYRGDERGIGAGSVDLSSIPGGRRMSAFHPPVEEEDDGDELIPPPFDSGKADPVKPKKADSRRSSSRVGPTMGFKLILIAFLTLLALLLSYIGFQVFFTEEAGLFLPVINASAAGQSQPEVSPPASPAGQEGNSSPLSEDE